MIIVHIFVQIHSIRDCEINRKVDKQGFQDAVE